MCVCSHRQTDRQERERERERERGREREREREAGRERERELLFFSIFQNFLALQTRLLKGNFLHGPLFLSLLW